MVTSGCSSSKVGGYWLVPEFSRDHLDPAWVPPLVLPASSTHCAWENENKNVMPEQAGQLNFRNYYLFFPSLD